MIPFHLKITNPTPHNTTTPFFICLHNPNDPKRPLCIYTDKLDFEDDSIKCSYLFWTWVVFFLLSKSVNKGVFDTLSTVCKRACILPMSLCLSPFMKHKAMVTFKLVSFESSRHSPHNAHVLETSRSTKEGKRFSFASVRFCTVVSHTFH